MRFLLSGLIICINCCGCATALLDQRIMKQTSMEHRVVNQFADALREDNEAALRNITSTRFEEKALRSNTAFRDLEILSLPKEKLSVVEVEKTDEKSHHVVVKDEGGTKYQFQLCRDAAKNRWVVDDVVFRQKRKGTRTSKSTTEVMDLLLTLREFLDTWKTDDRDTILKVVSSDLRSSLQELPDPWLKRLVGRVTAEYETEMARRPDAQLNDSDAVVKLPAKNGFLLVKVVRIDDEWLVADVELHNRKLEDHPGSIRRQAEAMNTVTRFLQGYEKQDQKMLKEAASEGFYSNALQFADLSMVTLPSPEFAPDDFEIRAFVGKLTVMIPDTANIVRIDLINPESEKSSGMKLAETGSAAASVAAGFVVREVMIYDRKTQHQTPLSSAFTAPARATLFMSMLAERDIAMLKELSSEEFSAGTWDRLSEPLFAELSLKGIPSGVLKLVNTRVRGPRTELEFETTEGSVLSVTLSDADGRLVVDDVQYPTSLGTVASLRTHLELGVPLVELASAWDHSDLESIRRNCSMEFNRLVWGNIEELPTDYPQLPVALKAPIRDVRMTPERATVVLDDAAGFRATVEMLTEKGYWVIDEVSFETPEGQSVDIRAAFRLDIAQQLMESPRGAIQQVSHLKSFTRKTETDINDQDQGVVHAHAEQNSASKGNLTIISAQAANHSTASIPTANNSRGTAIRPVEKLPTVRHPAASGEIAVPGSEAADIVEQRTESEGTSATQKQSEPGAVQDKDGDIFFFGDPTTSENEKTGLLHGVLIDDDGDQQESPGGLKPVPRIVDPSAHPIDIPN